MASKVKAKTNAKAASKSARSGRTSTSKISAKNQVTVPVDILRKSGIKQGDLVDFNISQDGAIEITLLKKESEGEKFIRLLQGALSATLDQNDLAKLRAQDKRSWR
jgi:bifunctional DNA-binding transcriptional regulator/antitoxin component of YhaV-PrlF toxin-antitoxin module